MNVKQRDAGPSYLLLFIPYGLATMFAESPTTSFIIAWLGSFAIIWLSFSGVIKPLPRGRSILEQVLRPIVLTQLIFITYTALTSIFNFVDAQGFYYFTRQPFVVVDDRTIELLAAGQRLYVLAHGALVTGLLMGMDYRASGTWRLRPSLDVPRLLTLVAVWATIGATVGPRIRVPFQITNRFELFGLVASVLCLTIALYSKQLGFTLLASGIYVWNIVNALLSGWKEEVTIVLMLLALFAYPMYRRTVLILSPLIFALLLFVLPAYVNVFRSLNWENGVDAATAAKVAAGSIRGGNIDLRESTWEFLARRSSEIGMFTRYIEHTPSEHPFYGLTTVKQAIYGLVPRAVWKNKPILETLAMERAYENGIVSRSASVSAKPQFVADAYLAGGALGVFLACLIYGLIASTASRIAEYCFGGYLLGSGLMYNALFMPMWRGNSFEFIVNDILWGFILLGIAFFIAQRSGFLVRKPSGAPRRATPRAVAVIAEA